MKFILARSTQGMVPQTEDQMKHGHLKCWHFSFTVLNCEWQFWAQSASVLL